MIIILFGAIGFLMGGFVGCAWGIVIGVVAEFLMTMSAGG